MDKDIAFEMAASTVRYGLGVTREVGMDLAARGARHVLVLTDPLLKNLPSVQTVLDALDREQLTFALYDRVRVEPSDESLLDAVAFANRGAFDAFVAVGGGSTIDTAKVVNLYTAYPPADFLDYVNAPIGKGLPIPGPLKPLMAIPTTAGTGSETTGVAIFDLRGMRAKTGIANRRLKPTLGYLDPENTRTMPPQIAASSGLDILSHGVESLTAISFTERPRPARPELRPAYQGSNPISDVWALQALRMVAKYLVRAVEDPSDDEARANMMLAASYAGLGFGTAGVHLPHGMSYPVSSNVTQYLAPGYAHGSSDGAARRLGHSQRARGVPLHRRRKSRAAPRGGRGAGRRRVDSEGCGRGKDSGRPHHLVHAAVTRAERTPRDWLLFV